MDLFSQLPIFRALKHRNYRLFFLGQTVSLVGTWMQQVALSWLVYRMTHSPFMLGLIGFVGMVPTFLCTPFAGVIADRHDRRRMLILTQMLSMAQASILTWLYMTQSLAIWHMVVLSALIGIINSFDIPIRQAFTVEMIEERGDLGNAIALNSSMLNGARLVGPSIAGILIASAGEGMCFLLNALSYIAVISSLFAMKTCPSSKAATSKPLFSELVTGLSYAFHFFSNPSYFVFAVACESDGGVFPSIAPCFREGYFPRGIAHAGLSDGRIGSGSLDWCVVSCVTEKCHRIGENHRMDCGTFWGEPRYFFVLKKLDDFVAGYFDRGVRDDGPNGIK